MRTRGTPLVVLVTGLMLGSFAAHVAAQAPQADLGVTKSGPASVTAGLGMTYTIEVSCAGPDSALDVQLSEPLGHRPRALGSSVSSPDSDPWRGGSRDLRPGRQT